MPHSHIWQIRHRLYVTKLTACWVQPFSFEVNWMTSNSFEKDSNYSLAILGILMVLTSDCDLPDKNPCREWVQLQNVSFISRSISHWELITIERNPFQKFLAALPALDLTLVTERVREDPCKDFRCSTGILPFSPKNPCHKASVCLRGGDAIRQNAVWTRIILKMTFHQSVSKKRHPKQFFFNGHCPYGGVGSTPAQLFGPFFLTK